jgi:protein-disulfide isomerase
MRNILILILSIVGLALSVKLSQIYFDANFLTGSTGHFCSINSVLDCNGVAQSKYSSFLGIPLAIYGIIFYLAIIGLLLLKKLVEKFRIFQFLKDFKHPLNYIHLMSIFSLFIAVTLAYISTFQIHKICVLCYITYGINALIFMLLATKLSVRKSIEVTAQDVQKVAKNVKNKFIFPFFSIIFISLILIANQTQVFVPTPQDLLDRGNILGDKNSHLRLYIYSDYNCPYCARMNTEVDQLAKNIDGLRVEKVEFPMDRTCNPKIKTPGFKNSCQAARYALAAKKQGKYLLMGNLLFEHNNNLSEKNILKIAKKYGINEKQLYQDANSQEIKDELDKQIRISIDTGINSTPSAKIGVKIYNYALSYDELYAIVSEYKNVVR